MTPGLPAAGRHCLSEQRAKGATTMNWKRALVISWLFAGLVTFTEQTAIAQTILGRISGAVRDNSGAVVPGAKVTVTNQSTGLIWNTETDGSGNYVVTNLPVGTYDVSAEAAGFKKNVRTGYALDADGRISADFVLQVGSLSENVEVTAVAGDTVNTVSGEVGRVISSEQMEDLALNGRNYMQLVSVIPGVALLDENQMAMTTTLTL